MYYYCKNGRKQIIHLRKCPYISKVDLSNLATFRNIVEAENHGYRICKHCAGLKPYWKREQAQIEKICKDYGISVRNKWAVLDVDTIYDQWKILFDEKCNRLQLYHKNAFESGQPGLIPHYHQQKRSSDTISGYLYYIIDHDEYRRTHPVYTKRNKPKKPLKGTNAWNKLQRKNKCKQKKQDIYHVLKLIDSLHTQPQAYGIIYRPSKADSRENDIRFKMQVLKNETQELTNQLDTLLGERAAYDDFSAVGLRVYHKKFGNGIISAQQNVYISAQFSDGEKRFLLPQSFTTGFLKTDDQKITELLSTMSELDHNIELCKRNIREKQKKLERIG